ncbi:hypothetical protein BS47DRAFT_373258 [Hydnum rufescens UP504]|uniref:C2H2-type domain-containing protein n=1 Tax=Hydnum rufescens UP504 TaxID=1448309 RepID=A0A9P6B5V9_9AGAM|nr:hypothetical protein BS47DRAFT_373258 [Hydnum rufescens UP504]
MGRPSVDLHVFLCNKKNANDELVAGSTAQSALVVMICNVPPGICVAMDATTTTAEEGGEGKDVPKPYKCSLCPMAFQQPRALEQHIKKHTGAKPYVCECCGREFLFKTNLDRHGRLYLQSDGVPRTIH